MLKLRTRNKRSLPYFQRLVNWRLKLDEKVHRRKRFGNKMAPSMIAKPYSYHSLAIVRSDVSRVDELEAWNICTTESMQLGGSTLYIRPRVPLLALGGGTRPHATNSTGIGLRPCRHS